MTIEMPYDYGVRILRMVNFARAGIEAKMVEGSIIDIDTHVAIEKCAGLEDAISKAHLAEKQLFFGLLQKDFIATLNPVY
jgi:hypothetical protein